MSHVRQRVIYPLLLIGVFVAGNTLGPGLAAAAQTIQNVLVVNTPSQPVPVSLTGTPTLNVGNFPATQTVTGSVSVGNTSADPVAIVDVNGDAAQPFNVESRFTISDTATGEISPCYSVPPGKRLVLEQVSVEVTLGDGVSVSVAQVQNRGNGFMNVLMQDAGGPFWQGIEYGRFYAEAGAVLDCVLFKSATGAESDGRFSLTGYLVDVP